MAQYSYTDTTGIQFKNITVGVKQNKIVGGKLQSSLNDWSDGYMEHALVNAVEIDWNGAEVEECLLIQVGESRCSTIVPSIAS